MRNTRAGNPRTESTKKVKSGLKMILRMDKWELLNLQTRRYVKPSTLEVAYLVTGLDWIQS